MSANSGVAPDNITSGDLDRLIQLMMEREEKRETSFFFSMELFLKGLVLPHSWLQSLMTRNQHPPDGEI